MSGSPRVTFLRNLTRLRLDTMTYLRMLYTNYCVLDSINMT